MKSEYWDVEDAQVIEKTGKPLSHWTAVLDSMGVSSADTRAAVNHLQHAYGVPRYWARTLTTRYLKGLR